MMGKTKKFSKAGGHSSSFVYNYRDVETMGESEGFGSSGRVEIDLTASEDSCAPKRKCISLNVDKCDTFKVPIQVLSLSKMSRTQRKELELKLKSELEQVLIVQKKFLARFANETTVSASSDIRGSNDSRKRPIPGSFHKESQLSGQPGKKQANVGRNATNLKRDISGRFKSTAQMAYCTTTKDASLMKQCEALLKRLTSHKFGWVFKEPVNIVKLNIPDYFNVIKKPMDLGTIRRKLVTGVYLSPLEFAADVRLTFSNALTYNPPGNDVHAMADTLSKMFETKWKPIAEKLSVSDSPPGPAKSGISRELGDAKTTMQSKKKRQPNMNDMVNNQRMKKTPSLEEVKKIMTDEEKLTLSRDLESLQGDMLEQVIDFLRAHISGANPSTDAEVEVDIDALSDETLFSVRKLLDDLMLEKQRSEGKTEACEIELLNESGLSNSSMQPCKVNDPADEDVDIGGNDPPVSSYPPVQIEKDAAPTNSKCSSSSSSSSESDSSSSGSDSDTSSGGESDGGKVSNHAKAEENVATEVVVDQERSDVLDPQNGSRSVNGLDQDENSTHSKPGSTEVDGRQEGGNAPSERQVSPEKRYRAAILRRRFADTILKAREKTLDKGDKVDPEKLRKEREELERQKRAERARLQAEAKAAEDARRQAEAEAAAEAKRMREIEREAARLALQKMEKTVEINENCEYLKDLELLGTAPPEHLPSSVDETSPNHSQDGLCGFKLGSNPLEQLGLYMKVDDEEEDEDFARALPGPPVLNDVEEGEID